MVERCDAVIVANPVVQGKLSEKKEEAVYLQVWSNVRETYWYQPDFAASLTLLTTSRIWCIVELFEAMNRNKAIIFRCAVYSRCADGTVALSSDGAANQLHNVSLIFDASIARASNPFDTFLSLVGAENKQALNAASRAALSAAALAAGEDVSALDAFVLGEPELLAKIDEKDLSRMLDNAVAFGYTEAVKALLQRKEPDPEAMCKAVYSAGECGRLPALKLLLDAGAATDFKDDDKGRSPFHKACERGHTGVVEELIKKGADIEAGDKGGLTPVYMASEGGHADVVKLLAELRADLNKAKSNVAR